ncbi:MAG TPA: hypothetical protein VLA36_05640 [Longimicrobiales bacterium]|nr:hypothetical protein [Longimicrobiales bacterium]
MTSARAAVWVAFVAAAAYANSLGNGFAYDDNAIIAHNPVVTEGRVSEALLGPYWNAAPEGGRLYRPVTLGSFVAEWKLWGGSPLGFHAANVLGQVVVSLLVLALLGTLVPVIPAIAGAVLFAVHPVHVEAVANVVGRAEIYAAIPYLLACLIFVLPRFRSGEIRAVRLCLISLLYLIGLGAKESAVTLPGALLVLEWMRRSELPFARRIVADLPLFASLTAVLGGYLVLRVSVLGSLAGESMAPALMGVDTFERLLTAVSLWPEYVRLLLLPVSLSADYSPAVLLVARQIDPGVVLGLLTLGAVVGLGWMAWRRGAPLVAGGMAWFALTILPVSNVFFAAGLLLGERTLYLPSVGLSMAVAGVWPLLAGSPSRRVRRATLAVAAFAGLGLLTKTVLRNPTWYSTFTVLSTLAQDHPESALAVRTRAAGLDRVGEPDAAAEMWRMATSLLPNHYGMLVEAARFFGKVGLWGEADSLLSRAIAVSPSDPIAYQVRAEHLLRQGLGREAHRRALQGLAAAGPDRALWALVSESYVAKGDLDAAVRARHAALAQDPTSAQDWGRLADLLEAMDRPEEAKAARARATESAAATDAPGGTT